MFVVKLIVIHSKKMEIRISYWGLASLAVSKDDVFAAIHAAMTKVAGLGSTSGCGGMIQTTSC